MAYSEKLVTLGNYKQLIDPKETPLTYYTINKINILIGNLILLDPDLSKLSGLLEIIDLDIFKSDLIFQEERLVMCETDGIEVYFNVGINSITSPIHLHTIGVKIKNKNLIRVYHHRTLDRFLEEGDIEKTEIVNRLKILLVKDKLFDFLS